MITALITVALLAQPQLEEVMHSLDQLYRSDDSHAIIEMHIVTEHWERTLEMESWSKGEDKTFIVIHSPAREAGSATLRVDTEMWNYSPNTNSTVRIPPSMMTGSWMGSDLTNNDIVKEITYAEDYTAEYLDGPSTGDTASGVLYMKLTPRASTAVVWAYIECAVTETPLLPLWERYYDRQGELIKTITFSEVQEMDGRTVPSTMRIEPADEDGQSTTITWSEASFNRGVSDDVFSLGNLQSGANR